MQLDQGIWAVDGLSAAHVYIIGVEQGAVIVDAGLRNNHHEILQSLSSAGYAPTDVRLIVVTHAHIDHIGSLPELQRATGAPVAAAAGEARAIEGHVSLPHPPGLHGFIFQTLTGFMRPQPIAVQRRLQLGPTIPQMPGWHVVSTPGHTPDHISLYHPQREWLIAGDAIANFGAIKRSPWIVTSNIAQARTTVAMLAGLPIRNIGFGHGPAIINDPTLRQQLARVAEADRYRSIRGATLKGK